MIDIRMPDMRCGPVRNRQQFLHACPTYAPLNPGVAFGQSLRPHAGHALADRLGKPVGFGVFDIKASPLHLFRKVIVFLS